MLENISGSAHVDEYPEAPIIRVSATSRSTAVAGAIAGLIREHRYAEAHAIGAAAVNQTVKAIAIAREYLAGDQIAITCIPHFLEVAVDNQPRTAVRFIIEPQPKDRPITTPAADMSQPSIVD
jgi:stage V sporulation protein S